MKIAGEIIMENRINKIIILENNKKYIVINQAIYKNQSYLLVNEINDAEDELLEEVLILKEEMVDGDLEVTEVTDNQLLDLLEKYLLPNA